ncbi:MAG TPA: hypothetical protein VEA58_05550, partial [Anaerovoracaceae bacterium]|nr:hypothetical protein [Anaerovoracaceae bacterium]
MIKRIARIILVCFALVNLLPFTALAAGSSAPPEEPYEKVAAKSGKWYAEQLDYDGKANLVIGYAGSWEGGGMPVMEMKIREEIVLTGVYLPIVGIPEGEIVLSLTDSKGNVYMGFSMEKQKAGGLKESDATVSDESGADALLSLAYHTTCIFTPSGDMELPKGNYTLTVEGTNELTGAFLVKGIHAGAYEKYKQALLDWELEKNPEKGEASGQTFGKEVLGDEDGAELEYGEQEAANPAIFALDGDYQIDEIIVSTYNDGQGALPGTISLIGENGQIYYSGQAYGTTIENIPNAAWKIAPDIVLPAGNYMIVLSQSEVLSYDSEGEPLFYVMASIPVQLREDFTGTYRINLDAYKTSTLAGSVPGKGSSFSLNDFELTVLDKEGEIELIGKYEGMPFSQRCEIVEETTEKIVAQFAFAADLSKLPYKAKIAANAAVTIGRAEDGTVRIDMAGTGVYDRAASAEKGADYNTYDLIATGAMAQRELPPFVMTALGKAGSAGNVPGPDNAAQAAAGILFPPLVGLVVNVVQEALKPK